MQIDLGPWGKSSPPVRLSNQKELEAIRIGCTWDSDLETMEESQANWVDAQQKGTMNITYPPKPDQKGKGKADPEEVDEEYVEGVEIIKDDNKTIPLLPDIDVPSLWIDVSSMKNVLENIDMNRWRSGMEYACVAAADIAKLRAANKQVAMKSFSIGWQAFITAIFWTESKSHGYQGIVPPLINAMVWEEAVVKTYRRELIESSAGGLVRKEFEKILDPYAIPTLATHFGMDAPIQKKKFIWWDSYRAPENPTTCKLTLDELIEETETNDQWDTLLRDLSRVNKIFEGMPMIRARSNKGAMPDVVHKALTSAYKVRFENSPMTII